MAVQRAVAERWKQVTGNVADAGVGPDRNLAGGLHQSARGDDFNGSIGLPIPSTDITIRDDDGNELAARPVRRDLRRGPAGDARLLEPAGRDRQGDAAGPRAAHRRHRPHGRARLRVHRGSQEGHDPGVGLQRVSERGRGRGRARIPACSKSPRSRSPTSARAKSSRCSSCARIRRLPSEQLIEHCRAALTGYKVPKHVYFRNELPKTNVGKILRRALRDELNEPAFVRGRRRRCRGEPVAQPSPNSINFGWSDPRVNFPCLLRGVGPVDLHESAPGRFRGVVRFRPWRDDPVVRCPVRVVVFWRFFDASSLSCCSS